jgi:hypothetical protein
MQAGTGIFCQLFHVPSWLDAKRNAIQWPSHNLLDQNEDIKVFFFPPLILSSTMHLFLCLYWNQYNHFMHTRILFPDFHSLYEHWRDE